MLVTTVLAFVGLFLLGSLTLAVIPNQMALLSTTVYLHRTLTHCSLKMSSIVELCSKFSIWMTTGIDRRRWAALHRKHHAHVDEVEDPHSPRWYGFWQIQLGNVFRYRDGVREPGLLETYAKDIRPDWLDKHLFHHPFLGLGTGITILLVLGFLLNRNGFAIDVHNFWANGLIGSGMGLTGALLHAVGYVFLQSSSVNGLCHTPHWLGYQHTDERQAQTTFNNAIVALFTGGEGLHHNHHWKERSARFARTKLELLVDQGWWIIWTLKQLGLVRDVKTVPLLN
jgi:stearoyl-CoA desaturase (delta-9 desaturase)